MGREQQKSNLVIKQGAPPAGHLPIVGQLVAYLAADPSPADFRRTRETESGGILHVLT